MTERAVYLTKILLPEYEMYIHCIKKYHFRGFRLRDKWKKKKETESQNHHQKEFWIIIPRIQFSRAIPLISHTRTICKFHADALKPLWLLLLIQKISWYLRWRQHTTILLWCPTTEYLHFRHGQILLSINSSLAVKLKPTPWGGFKCVHCLQFSVPLALDIRCILLDLGQGRPIYYRACMIVQKICPFFIFQSLWYSWTCSRYWYQIPTVSGTYLPYWKDIAWHLLSCASPSSQIWPFDTTE